jgi:tetratricopeptide (TPR) repeat protein
VRARSALGACLALSILYPARAPAIAASSSSPGVVRQAYRQSLALAETAAARNNLGECFLATHPQEAYRHFLRAYKTEPGLRILSNLALALIEAGEDARALPYLYRAYAALPKQADRLAFAVNYNLARALYNTGELSGAQPYAQRAAALWREGYGTAAANGTTPELLSRILNSKN